MVEQSVDIALCPSAALIHVGGADGELVLFLEAQRTREHDEEHLAGEGAVRVHLGLGDALQDAGGDTLCDGIGVPVGGLDVGELADVSLFGELEKSDHDLTGFGAGHLTVGIEAAVGFALDDAVIAPLVDGFLCPVVRSVLIVGCENGEGQSGQDAECQDNRNKFFQFESSFLVVFRLLPTEKGGRSSACGQIGECPLTRWHNPTIYTDSIAVACRLVNINHKKTNRIFRRKS